MNVIENISTKVTKNSSAALLTDRESEVLLCIAWGLSSREAGDAQGISPRTVEIHRLNLIRKLDARNAPDAVRIAMSLGMKMDLAA